ncbi:hypothetical protein K9U39_09845 [Rhodoblastus acidophilus]|uniref:Uncharacterized protein n=1 Tax=Candidatus Rhodoblastus alkanivorans TaxID=2954117 RepID=A0ABS9Z8E4_9HYPH|nr:hypothetical protein [Candidatus Rhodoblastus alkanivorans]MCI4679473.1 hypothetical protein [Candidatus Rhodoblastus alkanivorans]MCI4683918.1 hypothetical protein [Candidatus Rhodoblastus alkanivorans]MDI4641237.1 hypothetical protein [Rhodoblastus acidophilus]
MNNAVIKIFLSVLNLISCTNPSFAFQIWVSGHDPVSGPEKNPAYPCDFMDLFAPNAPWENAAKRVSVFKLSTAFVLKGTDDDLRKTFSGLKERHIALAVETGVLFSPNCGKGMEGFANPASAKAIAYRVKRLGGDLQYVAMDEQLWFGHFAHGKNACGFSISEIAKQVAQHAKEIAAFFPSVKIGAIEPISDLEPAEAISKYLKAYEAAYGSKFAFLHGDIQWSREWETPLANAVRVARSEHISFGPIIDSDHPADDNGDEWAQHAQQRRYAINKVVSPSDLNALIIQTWTKEPHSWLPETSKDSLTHFIVDLK